MYPSHTSSTPVSHLIKRWRHWFGNTLKAEMILVDPLAVIPTFATLPMKFWKLCHRWRVWAVMAEASFSSDRFKNSEEQWDRGAKWAGYSGTVLTEGRSDRWAHRQTNGVYCSFGGWCCSTSNGNLCKVSALTLVCNILVLFTPLLVDVQKKNSCIWGNF